MYNHRFKLGALFVVVLGFMGVVAIMPMATYVSKAAPLLAPVAAPLSASSAYTITDLGTLGGSSSVAYDINNVGQIAGESNTASGSSHAALWHVGVVTSVLDLGTLSGGSSVAYGLNDGGQVVGSSDGHAVRWTGGGPIDLGALPGGSSRGAFDINNAGVIVGSSFTTLTIPPGDRAVRWQGSKITNLGTLPNGRDSVAGTINDRGAIAGSAAALVGSEWHGRAVLWQGSIHDLGTLPGQSPAHKYSQANAINDRGQVVGNSYGDVTGLYTEPFLWSAATATMTELLPGFNSSYPYGNAADINNLGQVVGAAGSTSFRSAVLWDNGAQYFLQDLIPAGSGWTLNYATGINDDGEITGYGTINGQTHAFLLKPDPGVCPAQHCLSGDVFDGDLATDGHANRLSGVQVELWQGSTIVTGPLTTYNGAFRFTGVVTGTYRLRATLADQEAGGVLFDVRHTDAASGPVWIEVDVTVADGDTVVHKDMVFSRAAAAGVVGSNVLPIDAGRLNAMANIYYRTRQYTDWLQFDLGATLSTTLRPAPVEMYTFSTCANKAGAFYIGSGTLTETGCNPGTHVTEIYLSAKVSEYRGQRDTTNKNAPENGEWHEFTHHLYATNISTTACAGNNHGGYLNADTCDSFNEGLAVFLPTYFWQIAEGGSDSQYDGFHIDLESNNLKAWSFVTGITRTYQREDFGVAALLWDVYDAHIDTLTTKVITSTGGHAPVVYDDSIQLDVESLWSILSTAHPTTVSALRAALIASSLVPTSYKTISLDLDLDGIKDVSLLDEPFLIHGFFPYYQDGSSLYDPGIADSLGMAGTARNRAVGRTDHESDGAGGLWPRLHIPYADHFNLKLSAINASGSPLPGATLWMTTTYPEVANADRVLLPAGTGNLEYLELPPYYQDYLPVGDPLPACSPGSDYVVTVTLRATWNSLPSPDVFQFNNCQYLTAAASAAGDHALAFTFSFPQVSGVFLPLIVKGS